MPFLKRFPNRLVIFSGVSHHCLDERIIAHRGFVREVDIWARIFTDVLVVSRLGSGPAAADAVPYAEKNIHLHFLSGPQNTDGLSGKLRLALAGPAWLVEGLRLLRTGDILLARGPDSIGFLGWLVSRFTSLPRFAKYADQWENFPGEPPGYRLQKMFYRSRTFGGPVMIYGAADERYPHWVPFFTSGVSRAEWYAAGQAISGRPQSPPYRLLFAGRLVYFKGADILLQAMKRLQDEGLPVLLDLVGDGPEREKLEALIVEHGLRNVTLHGWLGLQALAERYTNAHIFVHPSRKEGFGKVLVEAMSYGLPIVGADVGVSRELVQKNQVGLLFQNENAVDLADQIKKMINSDDLIDRFSGKGRQLSQSMLLEGLEERYCEFIVKTMKLYHE